MSTCLIRYISAQAVICKVFFLFCHIDVVFCVLMR